MRAIENILVNFLNKLSRREHRPKSDEIVLGRNGDNIALWKVRAGYHLHIIGATRSGKSKIVEHILKRLTQKRVNWLLLDLHGDTANSMLGFLNSMPESKTSGRVIDIDFGQNPDRSGLPGLNPLASYENTETSLVVGLVMDSLRRRWGNAWGVRLEQTIRNAIWLLAENNLTLLELRPLLTNRAFRDELLNRTENPEVRHFWEFFDNLSSGMQNTWIDPVMNKFNSWLVVPLVHSVIGQRKTTIPFRKILDEPGKILVCNFAKGVIQSENALLLAVLFLPSLVSAIFSRADIPLARRNPFVLVIDEAQAFDGAEKIIETLLSEGGKYGLQLVLAHQHLSQFPKNIRSALLGNCAQTCVFRVSPEDANLIVPTLASGRRKAIESRLVNLPQRYMLFYDRNFGRFDFVKTPFVEDFEIPDLERNRFVRENIEAGILRPVAEIEREIAERDRDIGGRTSLDFDIARERDFEEDLDEWR